MGCGRNRRRSGDRHRGRSLGRLRGDVGRRVSLVGRRADVGTRGREEFRALRRGGRPVGALRAGSDHLRVRGRRAVPLVRRRRGLAAGAGRQPHAQRRHCWCRRAGGSCPGRQRDGRRPALGGRRPNLDGRECRLAGPDGPGPGVVAQLRQDRLGFAGTASGLYRTRNGARSWRAIETDLSEPAVQCLAVSPRFAADRLVLAGTEADGLLRSDDAGSTWHRPDSLVDQGVTAVAFSTRYPSRPTIAAAVESGIALSEDGGRTWRITAHPRG